jgi:RNA polymerase sigma factor (sigma-70 family)
MGVGVREEWRTPSAKGGPVSQALPHHDDVEALLVAAAAGSHSAWDEIVARYTNLLWAIGRTHRLDASAINDVIQTTWLRLIENLDRIHNPERLAGWLATTARRECLALLQHAGREAVTWDIDMLSEVGDVVPPLDHNLLVNERDAVLWTCFRRLSERCQGFLRVLTSVDRSSYAEVSAAFGVPVGSIGPTRMRCLDRLRELIQQTGYAFDTRSERMSS